MNLNQLKYFVAVAEHQNFTKAATQHYISQTAITQQVHALEESLGVKLVDRNTRPITLTPAGQVFLMEARAILERMGQAVERTREAAAGPVGTLRIGYTKGYESSDFSKKLRNFHQAFPNVHIACYRYTTDLLAAGLLKGEYDVIFTWDSTNIRQETWVDHHLVEKVRLMAVLYKGHPYARRTSLT
ncbi:MAG: LysR family transcriptional regulator, partial [Ruminiclostridium sp.]|nr:LysR family transcriptional regulator [Ruminiclostridium sp.]